MTIAFGLTPRGGADRGRRDRPPSTAAVADWCDALARRLRSGDTLTAAIRVTPGDPHLERVLAPVGLALDRGAPLTTALSSVTIRSAPLDTALTVLAACATFGGPTAEPVDRVAATLRRRVADAAERRAQSAQARLSALVLTVLPGAVLVAMAITSESVRHGVLAPVGAVSVSLGALLNGVGWWWMRRIIGSPT